MSDCRLEPKKEGRVMKMWTTKRVCMAGAVALWLATGTGTAFAQDSPNVCPGGIIQDATLDSLTLVGQSCYLENVTINGDLTVTNAGRFTIQNSDVSGTIRVRASGDVRINDSNPGSVVLRGNEHAEVDLVIADIAIRVIRNGSAFVFANAAPIIQCRGNTRTVGLKNQSASGNNCDPVVPFSPPGDPIPPADE